MVAGKELNNTSFFFSYFVNLDTVLDSELPTRLSTLLKLRRIFNDAHL